MPLPDPKTYLVPLLSELQKPWPGNRTLNLVVHGHSVPAGYFKTPEVRPFDSYPHLWHRRLKAQFPHAVLNVIVTAIGGENSESGAARFERDVLSLRPDLITIDYALNDRRLGLEKAARAWSQMIEAAKAKNIPLILLTPTGDTSARWGDSTDPLWQHAAQIRRLAERHGVGLADSLAAFERYIIGSGKLADLMSQVNHPNRLGHDLVTGELMRWFPE
jgi:acyl-CoA thioesterase I